MCAGHSKPCEVPSCEVISHQQCRSGPSVDLHKHGRLYGHGRGSIGGQTAAGPALLCEQASRWCRQGASARASAELHPGPPPLSARSSPPARRCPAAPQGWRGEGTRRGRPSSRPSPDPPAAAPPPGVSPGPGTTAGTGGAATVAAALPGPALGERAAPAELGHEVSGAGVRGRAGGAPPSRSDVGALGGAGSPLRVGRWGAGAEQRGCRTGTAAA